MALHSEKLELDVGGGKKGAPQFRSWPSTQHPAPFGIQPRCQLMGPFAHGPDKTAKWKSIRTWSRGHASQTFPDAWLRWPADPHGPSKTLRTEPFVLTDRPAG